MNYYEIIHSRLGYDARPSFNIYTYNDSDPGFKSLVSIHRTKAAADKALNKLLATHHVSMKENA